MDGILLIDKPSGMTSHDVVDRIRRVFQTRQVGHAGTLDPAATGLLILLLGKATRRAQTFLGLEKEYLATLRLGVTTDTQDSQGTVLEERPVGHLPRERIEEVLRQFCGTIEQEVPAYSAARIQGKRFYALARQGRAVPRRVRPVTIQRLKLLRLNLPDLELAITCSKGTYIRTLCAQIGSALGPGGHLATLRRIRIGPYTIEQAVEWQEAGPQHVVASLHLDSLGADAGAQATS